MGRRSHWNVTGMHMVEPLRHTTLCPITLQSPRLLTSAAVMGQLYVGGARMSGASFQARPSCSNTQVGSPHWTDPLAAAAKNRCRPRRCAAILAQHKQP